MRWKTTTVANAVALALALICLVAAFMCDQQYGEAHVRADKGISEARSSGVDFDPRAVGITSPEVYYQRGRAVRQWALPVCLVGLVVAGVTRKWQPAVALAVILVLTMITGGVRY